MYGTPALTVAVVIPCYRVKRHILDVIAGLPAVVDQIHCIDDACPEGSGDLVSQACRDPRVRVIRHAENQGVGGAVLTGYRAALAEGADIIVKINGDDQMDPDLIELFLKPIADGQADYSKGNRFHNVEDTKGMPLKRLIGNASLSFATKLSSGYWTVFDPTNGYTAIERTVARRIVERKVAKRYFFESDMLFHLYLERAVVGTCPCPPATATRPRTSGYGASSGVSRLATWATSAGGCWCSIICAISPWPRSRCCWAWGLWASV